MALVKPTVNVLSTTMAVVQWSGCNNGDTCDQAPSFLSEYSDRSFQTQSASYGATAVTPQGSNDGTNFIGLRNPAGSAISLTANDLVTILEPTAYIKPVLTGGTGTGITISIFCRRGRGGKEQ